MENTIVATFGTSRKTTTDPLYQYDYGQILKIEGIRLPSIYEVHFSNSPKNRGIMSDAIVSIGNQDGVNIPDKVLTSGEPIYAWLYFYTDATSGETEYVIYIPVNKRAQIDNPEPTPEEADVISQAIAALNNAVELTAADVAVASASADIAASFASDAATSASNALLYSENARDSADAARSYKEATILAKDRAEEILITVSSLHDETNGYKIEARTYADIAKESAAKASSWVGIAEAYAALASQSSEAARGYMSLALGYAQDAEYSKNEAYNARTSAQAAASSANQSAFQAQNFAQIADSASRSASTSASNAAVSASNAAVSASNAAVSESSAHYYADMAEQYASQAGYMYFYIDDMGHLIYSHTPNVQVDFYLYNGHLYVGDKT